MKVVTSSSAETVSAQCKPAPIRKPVSRRAPTGQDRDDTGHFLIYDERFVRRDGDEQPQVHAFCVAEPRWADDRFRVGGPTNWPERWDESFGRLDEDDRYEVISPYALLER